MARGLRWTGLLWPPKMLPQCRLCLFTHSVRANAALARRGLTPPELVQAHLKLDARTLAALPKGLAAAAKAARQGANRTATMTKAHAGRAAYVSEDQLRGHIDPGAEAVARLFEGI